MKRKVPKLAFYQKGDPNCQTTTGQNSLSFLGHVKLNKFPESIKKLNKINTFNHNLKKLCLAKITN